MKRLIFAALFAAAMCSSSAQAQSAADLARICRMLLNGGTLDGQRILGQGEIGLQSAPQLIVQVAGIDQRGPALLLGPDQLADND